MRKLMWFVIGFAAACGLCAYGAYHRWILPGGFLSVLLAVAAAGLIKRKELIPPMIAVLLGCIAGLGWFGAYRMVYLGPVTALEGETMQLCLTAQDYGYETGYGTSADSRVTIAGHRYQVRMYLTEEVEISPGDRITGIFRIELTMPEDYRDSAYLQGKGSFLLAYQTGEVTVEPVQHIPKWCYPAMIRRHIRTLLESLFRRICTPLPWH